MSAFLEISTMGYCILSCEYCPQAKIRNCYKGIHEMPLETLKIAVDKIPANSTVSFAGYSEPCMNRNIVDMVKYVVEKGHKVMLLTTLTGLTLEKYKQIEDITFDHFSIHLPDSKGRTKVPITKNYKELLDYISKNPPKGYVLYNHHDGDVLEEIAPYIPKQSLKIIIHDRAGNLEELDSRQIYGRIKCNHAFANTMQDRGAVMLPNGDCLLCCNDYLMENRLGNLLEQSWEQVTHSPCMQRIIDGFTDESLNTICRKCYIAGIVN